MRSRPDAEASYRDMAARNRHRYQLLLFCLCFLISTEATQRPVVAEESDRVLNLPGQPSTPHIAHFSGYINVHKEHGRALFYWFFEAQSQPSRKPLLLWLNGGPGCSSIGYGAAVELGPLRVQRNGTGLDFNENAWNKEANLLFVESPVGVGFSYTNASSDLTKLDDGFVAEDAYTFLVNWLQRFPQYQTHDFYISGESYGGHYVPQLADLVYERNKDKEKYPTINLKGFIDGHVAVVAEVLKTPRNGGIDVYICTATFHTEVGNPETDDYHDSKGLLEYAWSHAVISDQVYEQATKVCDFKQLNSSRECDQAMSAVFRQYQEIDIYNIYAPKCQITGAGSTTTWTSQTDHGSNLNVGLRTRIHGGYDPCFSAYAEEYFNRLDVQKSLQANINGKWRVCNDSILQTYNFTVSSVLPIYAKLIKGGLKVWLYSGDVDGRVPVIGSRYCMEALGLPIKNPWRSWYYDNQVAGRVVEYEGLTLVTVRGAGHLVPLNKPSEALLLINSFLFGHVLPTKR